MARRRDLRQVDAAARAAALGRGGRVVLGRELEAAKASGAFGSAARGDATPAELAARADAVVPGGTAAAVERTIADGARAAEVARGLRRLVGARVGEVRRTADEALALRFVPVMAELRLPVRNRDLRAGGSGTDAELRLPAAAWELRADGDAVARAADALADAHRALGALEGRELTGVGLRRRDGAVTLVFDDDPFDATFELLIRGRRRRSRGERWSLDAA